MTILNVQQIADLIAEEEAESTDVLHLTANETLLSPFAQRVLATPLYNRYLLEHVDMRERSPSRLGNFLFKGLDRINADRKSAAEVCRELFGADYVEFRCLSGLHAMATTFVSLTKPGDKIMRIETKDGGHFLSELMCRVFGRESCTYVFDPLTRRIDLDRTRDAFERERPQLLYVDAMNYLFPFPVKELREIAGDTPIVYDGSHTLGLIAGGQFQDPLREGADILQANTHKTFFGPQKGIILGKSRSLMERVSYTLSNALVSSQHTASTIALFIALHETYAHGRAYAARVIENARYLAEAMHRRGLPILAAESGFTQNHMFFIDVRSLGPGPMMLELLVKANISANRTIPFEHVDALRIGVQEVTRRGYQPEDLDDVADWFVRLLVDREDPGRVKKEVIPFVRSRRDILYQDDVRSRDTSTQTKPVAAEERPRPRWALFTLDRDRISLSVDLLRSVRQLGEVAGRFEEQTDASGNISVRDGDRLLVTVSGTYIKDLQPDDFAQIVAYDRGVLRCKGSGPPSAEAYMHYLVHQRVDAAAVVHSHYIPGSELERLDVMIIPPKGHGSIDLAEAVAKACTQKQVVYVRKHGLVFWGRSVEECRSLLEKFVLKW
ncbi:MAG: fluorothreonine transaldolase [Actinobacteria bacterium]|nr:fluorothreonine transaldolase [Actinomycetota bacterium]